MRWVCFFKNKYLVCSTMAENLEPFKLVTRPLSVLWGHDFIQ